MSEASSTASNCSDAALAELFPMVTRMASQWATDAPHRKAYIMSMVSQMQTRYECIKVGTNADDLIGKENLRLCDELHKAEARCEDLERTLTLYRDAAETRPERRPNTKLNDPVR